MIDSSTYLALVEIAAPVLVAHPELAVVVEVEADPLLLLVGHVAPLGRAVGPGAVPLCLVTPRVAHLENEKIFFATAKNI